MSDKLKTEKQTCVDCGKEFNAKVIEFKDRRIILSNKCEDCNKKQEEERIKKEKEEQEAQLEKDRSAWRRNSGIPPRFIKERFDTFHVNKSNQNIHDVCLKYATEFKGKENYPSLGLISKLSWGCGKSHLACSIAHKIIDNWTGGWREFTPVYYITESQLFLRIRGTFNRLSEGNNYETELGIYKRLSDVPLLIIDDVGKESVADPRFVQRVWFNIVNERYNNLKPIVITANLMPDEIAYHLGGKENEATFDRLYEMLCGTFYELTGKSYRRRETK